MVPHLFHLPDERNKLLVKPKRTGRWAPGDNTAEPGSSTDLGSPYAFIRSLVKQLLDDNKDAHLYVTGHRQVHHRSHPLHCENLTQLSGTR